MGAAKSEPIIADSISPSPLIFLKLSWPPGIDISM